MFSAKNVPFVIATAFLSYIVVNVLKTFKRTSKQVCSEHIREFFLSSIKLFYYFTMDLLLKETHKYEKVKDKMIKVIILFRLQEK